MFYLEVNNEIIGDYLSKKILSRYKSIRQFCIAYLKLQNTDEVHDESILRMQNRFTQILKGKKAIQTHDLPIVCDLLGMSCEELLSAGKCFVPTSSRVTNYDIAFSKDPAEWQQYVDRPDKLILNFDEYGKSVLDYAIEFKNYELLKFLVEKEYINFVFPDDKHLSYMSEFSADTSIKRREIEHIDILSSRLNFSDSLRISMITLAIENKDYDVLEKFRAKETPMLYEISEYISSVDPLYKCNTPALVEAISNAPDEVLDYFLQEYDVNIDPKRNMKCFFVYQHLDDLIHVMIKRKDARAKRVLEAAIKHNQRVYSKLCSMIEKPIKYYMDELHYDRESAKRIAIRFFSYDEKCSVIKLFGEKTTGLTSNIIRVDNVKSNDSDINSLITKLNALFDNVMSFKDEDN